MSGLRVAGKGLARIRGTAKELGQVAVFEAAIAANRATASGNAQGR
jgi:hypothetical protein